MEKVKFPLSEDEQDEYYDHTEIDRGNGTTFEVYKINGKYYDITGAELKKEESKKVVEESEPVFEVQTSLKEINGIVKWFHDLMEKKGVKPTDLEDMGAIYYMNSNDGTEFDWTCNNHTCDFMMLYKNSGMGFAKAAVTRDGDLIGCYWEEGQYNGETLKVKEFTKDPESFVILCYEQADMCGKYDEPINNIDWDEDIESDWYYWLNEEDEEDNY